MNGEATGGAASVQNWIGDGMRVSDQQNAELLGLSVVNLPGQSFPLAASRRYSLV